MSHHDDLLKILEESLTSIRNIVGGKYAGTEIRSHIINPLDGTPLYEQPSTQINEIGPFLASLKKCPKSGLHNPIKNVERYKMLGEVSFKAAMALEDAKMEDYFTRLIQSVMPKSYAQARGEVIVTRQFLKNFSGDQVRFLATGKTTPGDHFGQQPQDYQWPYGPVAIIAPFNFPLEIPVLQLMGALYMGNKPLIKPARTVSVVLDQFLRLLHWCGLPIEDVDLIHCSGSVMNELLRQGKDTIRLVQFTGSSKVAEEISEIMRGKVRIEDAGFDWKILGPDFKLQYGPYVSWQCDQDAYAASGQKCSATSILFAHDNWISNNLIKRLSSIAYARNLDDLTVGPVLSWTTNEMLEHMYKLLEIPGARLLFGGKSLTDHKIPTCYGALEPTAMYVPIKTILYSRYWELATKEVFGPFQVITSYSNNELPLVLEACERMGNDLTAAIVSDDPVFQNIVLGSTVNGTTYVGIRARTTGAPQNHWFGPCGDPRGAGIGTPQAIINTWSSPRCIIRDVGPIDEKMKLVQS
ncbi:MAG: aldehyde dehydrogenase family protein [Candidatus Paceibacterota bacterium]|jgi:1-pyrroline-5-carboxylate dehydrogenase|nr:aldehyde dehydrogenase family protein [Candidatus Paceibacterota bacterium]